MDRPYRIFYSYSHIDEEYLRELKEHLAPLRQRKLVVDWYDRMIPAGTLWEPQIAEEMDRADIFLMLVSSSFLNSNYCFNIEMNKALERANSKEALAIPIIIRECLWNLTPFQDILALPIDGIPIQSWNNRDKAWKNVVEGLLNSFRVFNGGIPIYKSGPEIHNYPQKAQTIIQNLEVTERTEPLVLGRDTEIQYLTKCLETASKPVTITSGFGGIGKSTLALKIAWNFYNEKKLFNFIAFVNCRTYGTDEKQGVSYNYILNEIARIGGKNDIASNTNLDVKDKQIKEMLKSYRVLLIFDNYESLLQYPEEEQKISKFINSLPTGSIQDGKSLVRVMITTRELSVGLKSLPSNNLEVEKMPLDACIEWMKQITPRNVHLTDSQYQRIWDLLYGLPKYIEIAIEQLQGIPFGPWEENTLMMIEKASVSKLNPLFNDLFEISWKRFDNPYKQVLMSVTYFIGDAAYDALKYTSGLSDEDYFEVLGSIPKAYLESTGSMIRVHPLTAAYCRTKLTNKKYTQFRKETQIRFIEYYHQFVKKTSPDEQEKEVRNIVAAAHLAEHLNMWQTIIEFKDEIEFRDRGYWYEQLDLSKCAVEACGKLGQEDRLAKLLVDDLGWLYLRFEKIKEAIEVVNKGLELYRRINNKEGIAQATRHLGKAAMIQGLDHYYLPSLNFEIFSLQAQNYYKESLNIRENLEADGIDQRREVADMYLDFGRLYWLQGIWLENLGYERNDKECINEAYQKYQDADEISHKAQNLFIAIGFDRGYVKSWGNLGNATKQIVKYALRLGDLNLAANNIGKAYDFYVNNAEGGSKIKRIDEISHGYWGLAEIYKIYAENPSLHQSIGNNLVLLKKALWYARESNKIYTSLGGTKDINATQDLIKEIEMELGMDKNKFTF